MPHDAAGRLRVTATVHAVPGQLPTPKACLSSLYWSGSGWWGYVGYGCVPVAADGRATIATTDFEGSFFPAHDRQVIFVYLHAEGFIGAYRNVVVDSIAFEFSSDT